MTYFAFSIFTFVLFHSLEDYKNDCDGWLNSFVNFSLAIMWPVTLALIVADHMNSKMERYEHNT